MSQEYTEDKDVTLRRMSSGRCLYEALLLVVVLFAVYLMASLISFDPSDPSWSQTAWHEPINNLGGTPGAWLADTFFFVFGVLAYAIPPVIVTLCWFGYRNRNDSDYVDYFSIGLRLIGMLALVLSSCSLAALNVDDWYYFASGGVIGSLLSSALLPMMNGVGATLLLLAIWAVGLTLFTGWSWLTIAEKIGSVLLGGLTFMSNRSRRGRSDNHDNADIRITPTGKRKMAREDMIVRVNEDNDDVLLTAPAFERELVSENEENNDPLLNSVLPDTETAADNQKVGVIRIRENEKNSDTMRPVHVVNRLDDTPAMPPLYSFDVDDVPFSSRGNPRQNKEEEPRLGDLDVFERKSVRDPVNFPVRSSHHKEHDDITGSMPAMDPATAQGTAATMAFTPAFTVGSDSQIKQGIGPELPRPNRVRVPTRRELASYGIKLPSQRMAQQQTKEETVEDVQAQQRDLNEEQQDVLYQAELNETFIEQPNARYGESFHEKYKTRQEAEHNRHDLMDLAPAEVLQRAAPREQSASFIQLGAQTNKTPTESRFTLSCQDGDSTADEGKKNAILPTHYISSSQAVASSHSQDAVLPDDGQSASVPVQETMDSLFHPFLVRNDQPLEKPTTPLPTLDLLTPAPKEVEPVDMFELEQKARLVEACLADYRVKADVVDILPGPVITRFELDLAPGVKAARISNLSRDLARSLSTSAVRVVEVIPGRPYVGLELPNIKRQTVYLREVLDCSAFSDNPSPLAVVLGKNIAGEPVVADLGKMPHLLVAGTTGSGKSVGVNAMILSILYKATPKDVRFIMIDPKMLELSVYEGIPHLLTDVVTDMKDAANALRWCVGEMERRYKIMSALGVRNIAGYNERIDQAEAMGRPIPDPFWKPGDSMDMTPPVLEKEPYIVVMVDEFADLIMTVGKKVEELIARLAQKARAAGIHLVLATQRPSVDVITGLIKANIPTRIAFTVSSKIDSRTILDQGGAESLLGMGDMLYLPPNSSIPMRVHGAFVRDQEVHAVVKDWKARERPQYKEGILSSSDESEEGASSFGGDEELDPLFDQAVAFVVDKRRASISGVQRQFRIGYNRAARIIEQMEMQGIVSAPGNNGNREVLAPPSHE